MPRLGFRAMLAGVVIVAGAPVFAACSPEPSTSDRPPQSVADPSAEPTVPATPDIAWTTSYLETFDDAAAAEPWIWEGLFAPTIADGRFSVTTQAGQAGYTGIGADAVHTGFGGGADDESLRTVRITAKVALAGIDAYGATCLDADSSGGYGSPSMYVLTASSTGANIWKVLDDNPSETVAASSAGVLPDPFVGVISVTCAPVDGGYYLEVALDGDVVLATVDTGAIPEGLNARLYDAAGSADEPSVSIDEVMVEVPAP